MGVSRNMQEDSSVQLRRQPGVVPSAIDNRQVAGRSWDDSSIALLWGCVWPCDNSDVSVRGWQSVSKTPTLLVPFCRLPPNKWNVCALLAQLAIGNRQQTCLVLSIHRQQWIQKHWYAWAIWQVSGCWLCIRSTQKGRDTLITTGPQQYSGIEFVMHWITQETV